MMGGGGAGGSGLPGPFNRRFLSLILMVGLGLWGATGFYRVQEGEQAVILQFGKLNRTTGPGLRYHVPAPFEQALIVPVSTINVVQSGDAVVGDNARASALRGTNVQDLMITGDENLIKLRFTVQWFVKDISHFLFNDPRPNDTVKFASESVIREVIAQTTLAQALTTGKAEIIAKSKVLMQKLLDEYAIGIEVAKVNLEEVNPPDTVIDAFRDVQRARADLESKINEAKAYRNSIIPVARGQGRQLVENAEAEKKGKVELAKGEAASFLLVLLAYQKAPGVTRERLRIENREEILAGMPKYLMSGGTGSQGLLPYLPLKEMTKPATGETK
jgi:membrane protease subunit HflK